MSDTITFSILPRVTLGIEGGTAAVVAGQWQHSNLLIQLIDAIKNNCYVLGDPGRLGQLVEGKQ